MKTFLSFINKEFFHIIRDPRTLLIILVMPIVEIILFGFALSNEVKNVRFALYNPANSEWMNQLGHRIDANENFILTTVIHNPQEIETLLRSNKIDMVLVSDQKFSPHRTKTDNNSLQIITDATDANKATLFSNYTQQIINQELNTQSQNPKGIYTDIKLLYNPDMKASYSFVPGVMGMILMLLCAMMTSISIVREKEMGTMEVLLVSPIHPSLIIAAKTIPYFILSCINFATILLLSFYLLHVPIGNNFLLLVGFSMLFIFVCLALGILISTLVRTQVAAMLMSGMILMMPVMVFSGLIFPTENMPLPLQYFSDLIAAKWYIQGVRKIMIQELSFIYVFKESIILSIMGLIFVVLSIFKFNARLES